MRILRHFTWVSIFLFFFFCTGQLNAVVDIGALFGSGSLNGGGIKNVYSSLSQLINPMLFNIYVAVGLVVFFVLLGSGFLYIMGAGQADGKKIAQSKQAMTVGLSGLLLIFISYWLILIIQTLTGLDILSGQGL